MTCTSMYRPVTIPSCTFYPLVRYLHLANVDEHYFAGSKLLTNLDDLIVRRQGPAGRGRSR